MRLTYYRLTLVVGILAGLLAVGRAADENAAVKEQALKTSSGVTVKVRMEGPYTANVPLQVVCYFKYTAEGAKKVTGAPVELDKRLGGIIAALRERGEFAGNEEETLLLVPPSGKIKAKSLLLIGLGDESALSLDVMERVGKTALREAARLGVNHVAYAPLIRDQGNSKFGTGDIASAVLRGVLRAYDTERQLQKAGFAKEFTLEQWNVEAGQTYFDDTVAGVQKAIQEAEKTIKNRSAVPPSTR